MTSGTCTNTNNGQHMRTAHLVDVFEFVYDLADDWLRWLVASGLGAGLRSLRARPRKPDRTGIKTDCFEDFH